MDVEMIKGRALRGVGLKMSNMARMPSQEPKTSPKVLRKANQNTIHNTENEINPMANRRLNVACLRNDDIPEPGRREMPPNNRKTTAHAE